MMLHPDLIKSAQPLPYPGLPEREELRKRSLTVMQCQVLNELQQGEPATCNAFAEFCANQPDHDIRYGLYLSRITGEKGAQATANAWVTEHVEKCREQFVTEEVERRILAAKFAALELQQ